MDIYLNASNVKYMIFYYFLKFKKEYLYFWREGNGGKKRGREALFCEETLIGWLPLTDPKLRTWPTAQACAPTGN